MPNKFVKHCISLHDFDSETIHYLLNDAIEVKRGFKLNGPSDILKGRTMVLIFEKPSLRTRVTFEVAMTQVGGNSIKLEPESISLGKRESVRDAAKNLSLWVDVIVARTFKHELVEKLAQNSDVPVINALTDMYHPCQAMAFGQTLLEKTGKLKGKNIVFVGDGNNVANSLALLSGMTGMNFTLSCPKGYEQPAQLQKTLQLISKKNNCRYEIINDPQKAVLKADVIYTDVWVSMGEEGLSDEKQKHFFDYQVNKSLLDKAPSGCLVSHCLPAHRGEEIVDEVMDSDICICFDEAENRLHVQKVILLHLVNQLLKNP